MKKKPRKPNCPPSVFTPAEYYVVHVEGEPIGTVALITRDVLHACDVQREHDPKMTWIVRMPDRAVLKIRNGSTADLKRLVQRHGGHL